MPRLVKQGFRGRIFCTPPTRELAEVLLKDAAHLQEEDADYLNRKGLTRHQPALPLFDGADVEESLKLFETVPLHEEQRLSPVFSFSFRDAGHLLGAASVDLRRERGRAAATRVLFSGDVGRFDTVLAHDPELAARAPTTWWSRAPTATARTRRCRSTTSCWRALTRTFARGGVLLIPAFAVGRAQQMIVLMHAAGDRGRAAPVPHPPRQPDGGRGHAHLRAVPRRARRAA